MAFMAQPWKHPSGIYYIRRRIPDDIKPILARGDFYKVSLQTRVPAEAKTRFAAEWSNSDQLFDTARVQLRDGVQLSAKDAVQLAARWAYRERDAMEQTGNFSSWLVDHGSRFEPLGGTIDGRRGVNALLEDPLWLLFLETVIADELPRYNQPPAPKDSAAFRPMLEAFAAQAQHLSKMAFDRSEHDHVTPLHAPAVAPLSFEAQRNAAPLLSRFFEDWKTYVLKIGSNGRDVTKRVAEYGGTIKVFIELYGDHPLTSVTRMTASAFGSDLLRMPTGGAGRRALTARQLIAKAEAEGLPTLSRLTVKNRLMALSALLSHAVRLGIVTENAVTASGVTGELSKAASKAGRTAPRKHYTRPELRQIFSSPVFQRTWTPPRASFGEAWYWIPLLLCYTGARREEIAQLKADEIQCSEEGVWYLDLLSTPDEDGDEDDQRTLKTAGSHRKIPLHPDLIELGFLQYAERLPQTGPLFPSLEANHAGYYGHNFGKRWSAYLKSVAQLDTRVRPSHGFRHTFITLCREQGVPEELRDALTGHDNGAVSRKYGERALLPQLLEQLNKLPSIAREAGLLPVAAT
ncbi:site-specific integrase [Pseudomonas seleniipraecipitans]|uniref:Site-specific integrase n=1 Tax=Phytopseudomonas seleniipraecipitans TaxID=640205 RepID=A0ABY5JCE4_9GAMM|nr:site-specific integrase [Pseudomonas seleniipraecipitans]UUD65722.1 site-specific integrase [Pseudomonas seleniipraecipitans]